MALVAAGLALVSWFDDLGGLSPGIRLLAQFVAVAAGVSALPRGAIFQGWLPLELDAIAVALIWVWFVNLFNFMDGIDGLAASEAAAIALGLVLIAPMSDMASVAAAIAAAALVGPAQVAARLVEFGALRRVHPLVSARLAALLHPIGAVILGLIGPGAITAFAVLHGAGNGLLTIAKGTVPLAIFGPVGYGLRSGILGAPARATQAASPLLFGLLMDQMGIGVLAISAGLSLSAFVALLLLKARTAAAPVPA